MRFKYLTIKNQVSQKNRFKNYFNKSSKNNIKRWNYYILLKKNNSFEFFFIISLKKLFKCIFKKNNNLNNVSFFWVFLKANFPISKKSKNSRMGKGKGIFLRWTVKMKMESIILKFKTVYKLNRLLLFLKKRSNKNIKIIKLW